MINMNFIYITLGAALIGILMMILWIKSRNVLKKTGKFYYIIPLIIIMIISSILIQETVRQIENIDYQYKVAEKNILDRKWYAVKSQLELLQEENFKLSDSLANQIIDKLKDYPADFLDVQLLTMEQEGNIIRKAVDETIKGVYFQDIIKDTNDPFVVVIGRGENDSYIFADFSQTSPVEEFTGDLSQEYAAAKKIAGGDTLARYTLGKILNLEVGNPAESYLFLQMEPRSDGEIKAVTLEDIKNLFMENEGDMKKTFSGLEFLAPSYIYRDGSISGKPRLNSMRVRTDAKILGVISSFGYLNVIDNDSEFQISLNYYDELSDVNQEKFAGEESTALIIGLLIMGIIYVLFMLFWIFMHMNAEDATKKSS